LPSFFFLLILPPPISTLFPYTTLFRSNDEFYVDEAGRVRTRTNNSGGVQGGISNGENIVLRVGFKPTATILREQKTVNKHGEDTDRKSTRLNSSHVEISYAVFCLKKKT